MSKTSRELLRVLQQLAKEDREAYREIRAMAWGMLAKQHGCKTPEQIASWLETAS